MVLSSVPWVSGQLVRASKRFNFKTALTACTILTSYPAYLESLLHSLLRQVGAHTRHILPPGLRVSEDLAVQNRVHNITGAQITSNANL